MLTSRKLIMLSKKSSLVLMEDTENLKSNIAFFGIALTIPVYSFLVVEITVTRYTRYLNVLVIGHTSITLERKKNMTAHTAPVFRQVVISLS